MTSFNSLRSFSSLSIAFSFSLNWLSSSSTLFSSLFDSSVLIPATTSPVVDVVTSAASFCSSNFSTSVSFSSSFFCNRGSDVTTATAATGLFSLSENEIFEQLSLTLSPIETKQKQSNE